MAHRGYDEVIGAFVASPTDSPGLSLDRVCAGCGSLFAVDGASVLVSAGRGSVAGLTTWGVLAARIEAEQFLLGEGPGVSASAHGRPELISDVATDRRFPAFAAVAVGIGLGAAFAFPLALGAIRLGVLSMYRGAPGDLDGGDYGDAMLAADVVTMLMLADQAGSSADGSTPDGSNDDRLSWGMDDLLAHRAVVHQATGMVAAQIDRPLDHALVRLRAYSFANGMEIDDVAEQVVSRRLRFDPDPSGES